MSRWDRNCVQISSHVQTYIFVNKIKLNSFIRLLHLVRSKTQVCTLTEKHLLSKWRLRSFQWILSNMSMVIQFQQWSDYEFKCLSLVRKNFRVTRHLQLCYSYPRILAIDVNERTIENIFTCNTFWRAQLVKSISETHGTGSWPVARKVFCALFIKFLLLVPTVTPNLQQKATSQVNYESADTPKSIQTLLCTQLKYRALVKKQQDVLW